MPRKDKGIPRKYKQPVTVSEVVIQFLSDRISTEQMYSKFLEMNVPKGRAVRYVSSARLLFDLPSEDLDLSVTLKATK